ncbi:isochorismatase family protein [Phytomonospora sp. NPDC050363]|uniref:isochorismatase family protein n=1 Tax=Phytomonospora sp. NPDC050363 TaxID=3155642 RepID=UPI0033DBDCC3
MTATAAPVEALIIVDVQKAGVTGADAVPAAAQLLERVAGLLDRARRAGAVVVHLQNDGKPGSADAPGTPGWELYLPVVGRPREFVIRKPHGDGFAETELGHVLVGAGVTSLAICGVMSDMCVAATARTAAARGFRVVLPHDAHATQDIPAVPWRDEIVSAAVAARAAEWALSNEVDITPEAADVAFAAT